MRDTFERVFLINLKRRPDRLEAALAELDRCGWPFRAPEIVEATDGDLVQPSAHWKSGSGAWGCRCSHVGILEAAIRDKTEPILVLEDDICFRSSFAADCEQFFGEIPRDWDAIFLGGQHHATPRPVSPLVVRGVNIQRTHAFSVRGPFLRALHAAWSKATHHIDWIMGPMVRQWKTYAPTRGFLIGQRQSFSDICGRTNPAKFWTSPRGNEPILLLLCDRETMESLRNYCVHTGYDRGDDGIDNGLRAVFASTVPPQGAVEEAEAQQANQLRPGGAQLRETQTQQIEKSTAPPQGAVEGLRRWIWNLQEEVVSMEGAILGAWCPGAPLTAELIRQCWRGPVHVVRSVDDFLAFLRSKP